MIGTTVGSYRITHKISVGGMGTVYKAEHTLIGKSAAVKVLHPELRANQDVVNRFFKEARATTQIKHPGIVEVFDFGYLANGDGYIIMEFLEGVSLARRLKTKSKLPEGEAAILMRGVCSALAAAHDKKIVHRDLKPDNIFLCPDPDSPTGERPKLLDFGIAKLTDASITGVGQNATKTGLVMGTPTYMSPEQCRGTGDVDHRSDLYSIGCIFYELVTGRAPFTDMAAGELIGAHLFMQPDPPSKHAPQMSPEAEQLTLQLIAKKPDERPQSARELVQRFAKLAHAHGWIASTNPNAHTVGDEERAREREEAAREIEKQSSPVVTDDAVGPTMASDSDVIAKAAVAAAAASSQQLPKPTTLSSAASQSVPDLGTRTGKKKTWLFAGMGAAVLAAGIGVGFVAVHGAGGAGNAPAAQPVVAPPQPQPTAPSPSPSPSPAAVPAPAIGSATATAPATGSATATATVPATATATATVPVAATAHTTHATTTHTTATVHKTSTTPTTKPKKTGSGSGSGKILIETDL